MPDSKSASPDALIAPPRAAYGRRIYAHVTGARVTCPRCGTIHAWYSLPPGGRRTNTGAGQRLRLPDGYQPQLGIWKCQRADCGYRAYVGIVLWPAPPTGGALPTDAVPTPSEAAELRLSLSYADTGRIGGRRERRVNVECTCAYPCPVHDMGGHPERRPLADDEGDN
jgi:hypothetical protein